MAIVHSEKEFFSVIVRWFPYPGHLALDVCEPSGKMRKLRMPLIPFENLPESAKRILKEDQIGVSIEKDIQNTRRFWDEERCYLLEERWGY